MRAARLAGFAVLLLALVATGCADPSEELPAEVVGRWVTTEPQYADRFLEIRQGTVRFGTGGSDSETYTIVRVDTEPHPRGRLIRITYAVGDEEMLLSFHHDPGDGTIRLQNQSSFRWTRAGAP